MNILSSSTLWGVGSTFVCLHLLLCSSFSYSFAVSFARRLVEVSAAAVVCWLLPRPHVKLSRGGCGWGRCKSGRILPPNAFRLMSFLLAVSRKICAKMRHFSNNIKWRKRAEAFTFWSWAVSQCQAKKGAWREAGRCWLCCVRCKCFSGYCV